MASELEDTLNRNQRELQAAADQLSSVAVELIESRSWASEQINRVSWVLRDYADEVAAVVREVATED